MTDENNNVWNKTDDGEEDPLNMDEEEWPEVGEAYGRRRVVMDWGVIPGSSGRPGVVIEPHWFVRGSVQQEIIVTMPVLAASGSNEREERDMDTSPAVSVRGTATDSSSSSDYGEDVDPVHDNFISMENLRGSGSPRKLSDPVRISRARHRERSPGNARLAGIGRGRSREKSPPTTSSPSSSKRTRSSHSDSDESRTKHQRMTSRLGQFEDAEETAVQRPKRERYGSQFPGGDRRNSRCPVSRCTGISLHLKHHGWEFHIPEILWEHPGGNLDGNPDYHRLVGEILLKLAEWFVGRGANVHDLVRYVNRRSEIPEICHIHSDTAAMMDAISRTMGWWRPGDGVYTLQPINAPGPLIHWRSLLQLVSLMSAQRRLEFIEIGKQDIKNLLDRRTTIRGGPENRGARRVAVPTPRLTVTRPRVTTQVPKLVVIPAGSEPEKTLDDIEYDILDEWTAEPEVPERRVVLEEKPDDKGFDAHFHLDRLSLKRTGLAVADMEVVNWSGDMLPNPLVEVIGGVINYCDSETYPHHFDHDDRRKVAVGFHPKIAISCVKEEMDTFIDLIANDKVHAVGEVGLDRTVRRSTWPMQDDFLEKCMRSFEIEKLAVKPLVLHLRGDRPGDMSVYQDALALAKRLLPVDHTIQLHCFDGDEDMVRCWRTSFPNAYFSYSGMVRDFEPRRADGLREVPLRRLLIETDAPYFPPTGEAYSTPVYIGNVAREVSRHRGVDFKELLAARCANARRCFAEVGGYRRRRIS